MKMAEAIDIGKDCGLETPRECYDNVMIHALSFFDYTQMGTELKELTDDYNQNYKEK